MRDSAFPRAACSVTVRTVDPTDQTGNHNSQVVHNVMNVFSNFTPTRTIWVAKTGNDTAPSGYNDPAVPAGLPTAPMDPVPSETGFRWGD